MASFTQARSCRGPFFPVPGSPIAVASPAYAPAIPPSVTGSQAPRSAFASVLLTCTGAPSISKVCEVKPFWSPSRPSALSARLALTMGSRPKASYYLHDISVGLAGTDSPLEPFSGWGEGRGRRPGLGAAAVQPLSGLPSEPWIPAGGGPPGTGMGLAGAPSLHLLSWVPWEAPAGKECQQSAGVVSWHRTQAGAARCQRLVKTLARAALPMPGVSFVRIGVWPSPSPRRLREEAHPRQALARGPTPPRRLP